MIFLHYVLSYMNNKITINYYYYYQYHKTHTNFKLGIFRFLPKTSKPTLTAQKHSISSMANQSDGLPAPPYSTLHFFNAAPPRSLPRNKQQNKKGKKRSFFPLFDQFLLCLTPRCFCILVNNFGCTFSLLLHCFPFMPHLFIIYGTFFFYICVLDETFCHLQGSLGFLCFVEVLGCYHGGK